ncbi:MAG TPA: acyl carrier protein [Chthoniobacterales bacterium]|jgi:acyl carrier protein
MDAAQKLKEYINNNRGSLPPVTDPDEPLHIDSLAFIRLVTFLDTDLNVRLEEEELVAENFTTLRAIENLIDAKSKEKTSSAT